MHAAPVALQSDLHLSHSVAQGHSVTEVGQHSGVWRVSALGRDATTFRSPSRKRTQPTQHNTDSRQRTHAHSLTHTLSTTPTGATVIHSVTKSQLSHSVTRATGGHPRKRTRSLSQLGVHATATGITGGTTPTETATAAVKAGDRNRQRATGGPPEETHRRREPEAATATGYWGATRGNAPAT